MRDSEELIRVIYQAVLAAGIDVEALAERMSVAIDTAGSITRRSRHRRQLGFWSAVQAVTNDPDIGLRLCRHLPIFRGHILEYIYLSSATLREGLRTAKRYHRLISDAFESEIIEGADTSVMRFLGTSLAAPALMHSEVCYAYGVSDFLRRVTDGVLVPERVALVLDPRDDAGPYEALFGCPVCFGATRNELHFNSTALDQPGAFADPEMLALHIAHADRKLEQLAVQDLIDRVLETLIGAIIALRGSGDISLAAVADELSVPVRTLRAELAAAGTSYRALLASARVEIAMGLLEHSTTPVAEVARHVGFSEVPAFRRAFKAWSGLTPTAFRQTHAGAVRSDDIAAVLARIQTL